MNNKILKGVALGCGVMLLAGCGSSGKTLSCEYDMSDQLSGLGKWNTTVNLEYDKDGKETKNASMKMVVEVTSDDVVDEFIDSLKDTLDNVCANAEDEEGNGLEKCEVKRDGKVVTLEAKGSVEKIDSLDGITSATTYDEAKKLLEEQGFTCK